MDWLWIYIFDSLWEKAMWSTTLALRQDKSITRSAVRGYTDHRLLLLNQESNISDISNCIYGLWYTFFFIFYFFSVQTMSSPLSKKMAVHVAKHCKGYKPTLSFRLPSLSQWLDLTLVLVWLLLQWFCTCWYVSFFLFFCFTSMSGILMLNDGRASNQPVLWYVVKNQSTFWTKLWKI